MTPAYLLLAAPEEPVDGAGLEAGRGSSTCTTSASARERSKRERSQNEARKPATIRPIPPETRALKTRALTLRKQDQHSCACGHRAGPAWPPGPFELGHRGCPRGRSTTSAEVGLCLSLRGYTFA